ncbi:MAG: hypothetical protein E7184_02460 [Erysipelotrichaceae bacterium]|nr:hypothetical protein [Erysipelotrichaceae bacterium]
MKNKLGKILSISFIVIGYLACLSWSTIELYKYYGWSSLSNSSLFMTIFSTYQKFTANGIAWFYTYFVTFSLVLAFGYFSYKCLRERKLAYYKNNRVEIKITKDASFYDKAYDEFTPVSAYSDSNSKIDLESRYDYLMNK